jgi:hypothetical protein
MCLMLCLSIHVRVLIHVIVRNAFQEELFQSDNEILELNLDAILKKTNHSTPVNTITMPPSTCTSTRYAIRNIRST